ncbi:hypothetical protein SAMN02745221_00419 [Thermosyntropha lipolytica DSM 11003]|uniref:Probable cell division protein WhiA n=1 Tax=Thermosyntropha lipolytica DSM 11003 TaxID=1123382 RepID=A0A1M5KKP1_9FIRM|nr:DNA-binding protein WhiA [Thermosyntropha lipolytica]SHG53326.1 hypothetical protein SAMN02745221_00419 [Thermosyntropha lipolytica DSM 11003]
MSFSQEVKNELTRVMPDKMCCQKAELAAFLAAAATIRKEKEEVFLRIETESASSARKVFLLIKRTSPWQPAVRMENKKRFNKERIYVVNVPLKTPEDYAFLNAFWPLDSRGEIKGRKVIKEMVSRNCCRRSYMRGIFLSRGFISRPEEQYHLEITLPEEGMAGEVQKILQKLGLEAKKVERKNMPVLYIKDSEKIGDFLRIIGASKALLHYENVRIIKSMRNDINRQVNCETANLTKTIDASMRQIELLERLKKEKGFNILSPPLRELALLRLEYPDLSLKELGEMLDPPLSKSGVAYRMRKLEKTAEDLLHEL